jgi:hypothetical protein
MMRLVKEIAVKDNWIAHTEITEDCYLVLSKGPRSFSYAVYSFNTQDLKYNYGFYFYSAQEALEHYEEKLNVYREETKQLN